MKRLHTGFFSLICLKNFLNCEKDFPTPDLVKGVLGNLGLAFLEVRIQKSVFILISIVQSVLMTQIIGRKRVILISPVYDKLIYKVPLTSFSMIEPDRPDYNNFSALRYVEGYDFIIHPGDALFMPSRFWHFNTYLEGGMAVSYRTMANNPSDIYNGLMNTTLRLAFDKFMNSLMGDLWMEKKKIVAMDNANNMIKKLHKEQKNHSFIRRLLNMKITL